MRDHCHYIGKYRGAALSIYNLRYKTPKEIPVVFHNVSTYDYHFIIKELTIEFESQFACFGENTDKIYSLYQLKNNLIMVKQLHTN